MNLCLIIPTSKELVDVEKAFMYNLHDLCLFVAKVMWASFETESNTLHPDFCLARAQMWDIENENVTKKSFLLIFYFLLMKQRLNNTFD